ncbi:hypothetical protein FGF1_16870 [Flavobacteriaceae bacterium GF1]
MKSKRLPLKLGVALLLSMGNPFAVFPQSETAERILMRYVEDYQKDIALTKDALFGIKVDTVFWHVKAKAKTETGAASVQLFKGEPPTATYYFKTDLATLEKIDKGELNALTASAKAFSTDVTPFDVDTMTGFQPNADFVDDMFSVYFHFWTRGIPERIPFGLDYTRFTHGAQASIFYYQKGFRSGYFALKKGQHANEDERSKSNPFPSLFIAIKGEATIIIDGLTTTMKAGEAILVPANSTHEFLNKNDIPFEGFLFMFGEGA